MATTVEQVRLICPPERPRARPARACHRRGCTSRFPSYTRSYPLVVDRGEGAIIQDVDGNRFLDFNAGIAVVATGHAIPGVVKAISTRLPA